MLFGAVVLRPEDEARMTSECETVAARHGLPGLPEWKWTKVSRAKLSAYIAIVDCIFDNAARGRVEVHILSVKCAELDHRTYNAGDPDIGFNKFLYQLLLHKVGIRFGDTERLYAYLDARTTTHSPSDLQLVLNNGTAKKLGDHTKAPWRLVVHRDSKTSRLLQVADIMTGAHAFHKNGHHRVRGAAPAKLRLAEHIAARAGVRELGHATGRSDCTMWNFQLRPRRGP
jgi:hypothetical protein